MHAGARSGADFFGRAADAKTFAKLSNCPKFVILKRMSRIGRNRRLGCAALATLMFLFSGAGCSMTPKARPPVTRVVLVWMKDPGSAADRSQVVRAARSLRMIPGVTRVETGRDVPVEGLGLDRTFDLGVMITFRDRASLQRYEKDPRHLAAMRRYLKPLVRRYEVFNVDGR